MFKARSPSLIAHISQTALGPDGAADAAAFRRSGRLLGLIRKLINYGMELLTTVGRQPPLDQLYRSSRGFGTRDGAVIIAHTVRGLRVAAELEHRILSCAAYLDTPHTPKPSSTPAPEYAASLLTQARRGRLPAVAGPAPLPAAKPQEHVDALLEHWPTSEEIGAQVRGRPIGVVLSEICHDLGIGYSHPLWWELLDAIDRHGGKYARFMRVVPKRKPVFDMLPDDIRLGPPAASEQWPSSAPRAATGLSAPGGFDQPTGLRRRRTPGEPIVRITEQHSPEVSTLLDHALRR